MCHRWKTHCVLLLLPCQIVSPASHMVCTGRLLKIRRETSYIPPIYGSPGISCPRTDEGESPTLRCGAGPLEGAPSTVKKGRSRQQPMSGCCCWRVCRLPTVVGNCWVHCVPLVSQVYFRNQHKKKMMRAMAWRRLCFHLRPIAWDRKQKSVQMGACEIMMLATMETQTSPCRMCPAPSCRPRPLSVAAT